MSRCARVVLSCAILVGATVSIARGYQLASNQLIGTWDVRDRLKEGDSATLVYVLTIVAAAEGLEGAISSESGVGGELSGKIIGNTFDFTIRYRGTCEGEVHGQALLAGSAAELLGSYSGLRCGQQANGTVRARRRGPAPEPAAELPASSQAGSDVAVTAPEVAATLDPATRRSIETYTRRGREAYDRQAPPVDWFERRKASQPESDVLEFHAAMEEAAANYRKALELDGTSEVLRWNLASALEWLGQLEESAKLFSDPEGPLENLGPTRRDLDPAEVQKPVKVLSLQPVYPESTQRARVEGTVILDTVIDTAGNIAAVKVLEAVPGCTAAAIRAVRQWKFKPAVADGTPVAVYFTVTVNFALTKGLER